MRVRVELLDAGEQSRSIEIPLYGAGVLPHDRAGMLAVAEEAMSALLDTLGVPQEPQLGKQAREELARRDAHEKEVRRG